MIEITYISIQIYESNLSEIRLPPSFESIVHLFEKVAKNNNLNLSYLYNLAKMYPKTGA